MKTNELTVGDWVVIDGTPRRIDAVHQKKVGWHARQDKLNWTHIDRVQPVGVTPGLMRWNGFSEDSIIRGWYRRSYPEGKTVSVFLHDIWGKYVGYDFWVEQPFNDQRQTKSCRTVREMGDLMILKREQIHRSMADVDGLHYLQHAMNDAGIEMQWSVGGDDIPEERQEIDDCVWEYITSPEQSHRLIASGMPRESADMKAVPFEPKNCSLPIEAMKMIYSKPDDIEPVMNRPFGGAFVAWTNQRMVNALPSHINLQLEYDLEGYIYRHGDKYVVGYKSNVQQVEYRKPDLSEALVEMLRYLLQWDFSKRQLNIY